MKCTRKFVKGASSLVLMGLISAQAIALPIYLDGSGREWLDPNATRFRSWNDTSMVCDATGGDCSGVLATHTVASSDIDVTGYRWATRDEVRELFYEIGGLPSGSLDTYFGSYLSADGHGVNVFTAFDPTIQFDWGFGIENILHGLTRDSYFDSQSVLRGYNGVIDSPPFGSDSFNLTGGLKVDAREMSAGVFLYRAAVPEPGTLALFGLSLLAVMVGLVPGNRRVPRLRKA
jgi:hypothetical protein